MSELLTFEIISPEQAKWVSKIYRQEVLTMTPTEAVQVTDSFAFTDFELGSVLGRYDGNIYETLWDEVRSNPINYATELKEEILNMIRKHSKL